MIAPRPSRVTITLSVRKPPSWSRNSPTMLPWSCPRRSLHKRSELRGRMQTAKISRKVRNTIWTGLAWRRPYPVPGAHVFLRPGRKGPGGYCPGPSRSVRFGLEDELQGELHLARIECAVRFPENTRLTGEAAAGANPVRMVAACRAVRRQEVGTIQGVEHLPPELEGCLFADLEVLEDGLVGTPLARPLKRVSAEIAIAPE